MSDIKKFLDLDGLTTYHGKIKQLISGETAPGKNADKAFRSFLGDPTGYPDENIPLYSETVTAAADAKEAAITAQNSATNSAAAAAESAQTAANILGKSDDTSDKNTVYGVYAKVDERVNTGLGEIADAVDDGIRTLQDKAGEISGDLDKYVIDEVKPVIDDTKILAVNAVNGAKGTALEAIDGAKGTALEAIDGAKGTALEAIDGAKTTATNAISGDLSDAKAAIATDLAGAKQDISKDLANAKAAITTDLENAQSAISGDLTSASETISAELTAATDAIDIAQADAEAAIAADLTDAQSTISGDLASAKQEIIDATITATNTISADLTTAKQDITNAKTAAVKDVNDAVAPVTAAKNDAEAAKNAAVVAKDAAEAAANTATNAVTGFRDELGDRPTGIDGTVWGNIETLKSSVQGGVHFIGTTDQLPWEGVQNTTIGRALSDNSTQEYSVGDIIIVATGGTEQGFDEPTKEYILAYGNVPNPDDGSMINGYRWVELGDVSPADQKITVLETNKLNKSALVQAEYTLESLVNAGNDDYILVERTTDDHALIRIGAIPTSDINKLFD